MKSFIKLILVALLASGLVLGTGNIGFAGLLDSARESLRQAKAALDEAAKTADAKATAAINEGYKTLDKAQKTLEDAGKAVDIKAKEMYNSVKQDLNAVKKSVKATSSTANKALKDATKSVNTLAKQADKRARATIKEAKETLKAVEKAADAKANEMYESAKENLKALKEGAESTGTQAYQAGVDTASATTNALTSIATDASNKVNDIYTGTRDAIEAKYNAMGESVQQTYDSAAATGDALIGIAAMYAEANIRGSMDDGMMMADISEKLKAGDYQGAKDASLVAANKKLVDSLQDPAIGMIQQDMQAAFKRAEQRVELDLRLQGELGLTFEEIHKIETSLRETKAKNVGLSPEEVIVSNFEIEMSAKLYKALEIKPVILLDNETIEQGAKVYYEGARAYVEEVDGVKVPSADKAFGGKDKDSGPDRSFDRMMRGTAPRPHVPCH